ncbi:hypothetical protein [Rhizobium sp. 23-156E]
MTPKRYQSGDRDVTGSISNRATICCGTIYMRQRVVS